MIEILEEESFMTSLIEYKFCLFCLRHDQMNHSTIFKLLSLQFLAGIHLILLFAQLVRWGWKKAASGVLANFPCSRTGSRLCAQNWLRPYWTNLNRP